MLAARLFLPLSRLFAAALGLDSSQPGQRFSHSEDAATTLERIVAHHRDDATNHENARLLRDLLESLTDTLARAIGQQHSRPGGNHPVYVAGLTPDGQIVGVYSEVIWT